MKYCLKAESVYKESWILNGTMKQEVCLLPVRCKGCSVVFDLWHDLQSEQEQGYIYRMQNEGFRRLASQSFCWHCRKVLSGEAVEEPEKSNEEPTEETQTELYLSLAYDV